MRRNALVPTASASLIDAGNLQAVTAVKADFGGSVEQLMSAMNITFGMAGWLALGLHAIGVEVYVSLSFPDWNARLIKVHC